MKEGKQKLGKIEREKIIQKETIWEILETFQWDFFFIMLLSEPSFFVSEGKG